MFLKEAINTDFGSIIISVILGLGLAALFRKICEDDNCIILVAPKNDFIKENTFKFEDGCYRFEPEITNCEKKTDLIRHK